MTKKLNKQESYETLLNGGKIFDEYGQKWWYNEEKGVFIHQEFLDLDEGLWDVEPVTKEEFMEDLPDDVTFDINF